MAKRPFGVSTLFYRNQRLQRDHLREISGFGFEVVDLAAADGHFDPGHEAAVADLSQWLAEAKLTVNAVALPSGAPVERCEEAVFVARRIPVKVVTVHAGSPRETAKTVERLAELAAPLGTSIAVDSRSESMSPIGSLLHFVEKAADTRVGVSLDFETTRRPGDLIDAIEMSSEHLVTVTLPVQSTIDWSAALTTLQKVGYEGAFVFNPPPYGSPKELLARARDARRSLERCMST